MNRLGLLVLIIVLSNLAIAQRNIFFEANFGVRNIEYLEPELEESNSLSDSENKILEEQIERIQSNNSKMIAVVSSVLALLILGVIVLIIFLRRNAKKYRNLYQESNHRIKNNLATIDHLISKKKEEVTDQVSIDSLSSVQSKLYSFYAIHEKLVHNESKSKISLNDYLKDLIKHTEDSFGNEEITIRTMFNQNIKIDVNKSCVLGMILNEFVTNSVKHASCKGKPCISVSLEKQGKHTMLTLNEQNVVAEPKQKSSIISSKKGVKLISNLCKQIDAKLTTIQDKGLEMLITLER